MYSGTISKIIKQILIEKDRIFIPGFGTLLRTYVPAKFNPTTNVFKPPQYLFEFDSSIQYEDPYLAEVYAQIENIPHAESVQIINQFGERLKRDLHDNARLHVEGILTATRQGQDVFIQPEPSMTFESYPELDLNELWESDDTGHRGIWWEFGAFISLLLIILVAVNNMIHQGEVSPNYPYQSDYPPLIGKMDTKNQSIEDLNDTLDMVGSQIQSTNFKNELLISPAMDSTIIVVGAFSSNRNIDSMKSKLADKGWDIYEEKIKRNLVRIGLVPEEYEDVDEVLGIVRNEIEPEAWVLKKN